MTNRTGVNQILIAVHRGNGIECVLDAVYATVAANWVSTDVYGQLLLASISEQAGGSRWGGPVYAAESRADSSAVGGNLWTNTLSRQRVAAVRSANILPTTADALSTLRLGLSWHGTALIQSTQELLARPNDGVAEPATLEEVLALSKGTLTLICCTSCAACGQDSALELHSWAGTDDVRTSSQLMHQVRRFRRTVDEPLRRLRARLGSDSRPDAIYRLTAEAMMTGSLESRFTTALLEALTVEDALYHGTDLLSHCAGWVRPCGTTASSTATHPTTGACDVVHPGHPSATSG